MARLVQNIFWNIYTLAAEYSFILTSVLVLSSFFSVFLNTSDWDQLLLFCIFLQQHKVSAVKSVWRYYTHALDSLCINRIDYKVENIGLKLASNLAVGQGSE